MTGTRGEQIMIPRGWKVSRIDEIGKIQSGRQRSPHFVKGALRPYLRVANVFDGHIDTSDVLQMVFSENEYKTFNLSNGDILLNEGQSLELVGRSAIFRDEIVGCCFQNTLLRFRPFGGLEPEYAQLLFQFLQYSGQFSRVASRTTSIAHLGASRLATLKVLIPTTPERQIITRIIACWDRAIISLTRLTSAKTKLKSELGHRLLAGHKRYPSFRGLGRQECHLGEFFTERQESSRGDLPLLSITATRGLIPRDQLDKKDSSAVDKSKYKRIAPGDIGYNTMRMWQGVSVLSSIEGIVSPAYTICIPGPKIDGCFAKHLFKYPPMVRTFWRYSQGLVDDTLSLKYHNFALIKVKLPPIKEQRRIAELLDAIDREIDLLTQQSNALSRQKKALMEKLLTGRIRVIKTEN